MIFNTFFNNNTPYNFQRFGANNNNNNFFILNSNQNMNNNFISSTMNANNMSNLNNINSFMNTNISNHNMNFIINISNEISSYMSNMNNFYSLNNAYILIPNYFFLNNNNPFPFKQEVTNSPNDDPNYSKILLDSLTNSGDNINDNTNDKIIDNIIDNKRKPINLSKNIIYVSPDEKEDKNIDIFYYHLWNFNAIIFIKGYVGRN